MFLFPLLILSKTDWYNQHCCPCFCIFSSQLPHHHSLFFFYLSGHPQALLQVCLPLTVTCWTSSKLRTYFLQKQSYSWFHAHDFRDNLYIWGLSHPGSYPRPYLCPLDPYTWLPLWHLYSDVLKAFKTHCGPSLHTWPSTCKCSLFQWWAPLIYSSCCSQNDIFEIWESWYSPL